MAAAGKLFLVLMVGILMVELEGSVRVRVRAMTLCNMDDAGLDACKPSVSQPNPVEPSPDCCKALKGADLTCLCSYKNSVWLPTFGIDPALALSLPPKCQLQMPPSC